MNANITITGSERDMWRLRSGVFLATLNLDGSHRSGEEFDLMERVTDRIDDTTTSLSLTIRELAAVVRGIEIAAADTGIHPADAAAYSAVRDDLLGASSSAVAVL